MAKVMIMRRPLAQSEPMARNNETDFKPGT